MNNKYFVLGLPRTGTTSLCVASLDMGLKTAHTAYTQSTIKTAQLIADTPVYNDFEKLYQLYPNSRFIYLERDMPLWVPSIRQLLTRMRPKLIEKGGGFNETLKRCYLEVFPNLDDESLSNDDYLVDCYQQHKQRVTEFLNITKADCLFVDLAQEQSNRQLAHFMNVSSIKIPHINRKGKVTAWNEIKHPLKIESTRIGKVDKDALLYHFET
ncbi:sulfotransferase family protein [Pseudoalteromonas sp. SMS1]|uniref:sulfotransferase n=1 Tax=Pseudoalteromonas sp. SMS1 TaxID=2908894 RepID=UPI001F23BF6F|nr:sulfotransferase [Pseudoalteromonas sp. SMS1]MCF2858780.1 sulfotransferase family protein [Pseudoalteromonas sp. SMS1]